MSVTKRIINRNKNRKKNEDEDLGLMETEMAPEPTEDQLAIDAEEHRDWVTGLDEETKSEVIIDLLNNLTDDEIESLKARYPMAEIMESETEVEMPGPED